MSICNVRLLIAIFSHERFIGLRNLVLSIESFIPGADILVIDDNSRDGRIASFLDERMRRGALRWMHSDRSEGHSDQRLGKLHSNMNVSLKIASDQKFDLMLLLQDDQQVLWFDEGVLDAAHRFLIERNCALMLDPRFVRFSSRFRRFDAEKLEDAVGMERGAVDVGFIIPQHATEIGFKFGASERESSDIALALGQKCYQSRYPFIADVPTYLGFRLRPPFFWGRQWDPSDETKLANSPILYPLNKSEVDLLKACPKDRTIIAEDLLRRADRRRWLIPHFYNAAPLDRYVQLVVANWIKFLRERRSRGRELPNCLPSEKPYFSKIGVMKKVPLRHRVPAIGRIMLLCESFKTGLFLLFIYPIVESWMKRNSREFLQSLKGENPDCANSLSSFSRTGPVSFYTRERKK